MAKTTLDVDFVFGAAISCACPVFRASSWTLLRLDWKTKDFGALSSSFLALLSRRKECYGAVGYQTLVPRACSSSLPPSVSLFQAFGKQSDVVVVCRSEGTAATSLCPSKAKDLLILPFSALFCFGHDFLFWVCSLSLSGLGEGENENLLLSMMKYEGTVLGRPTLKLEAFRSQISRVRSLW